MNFDKILYICIDKYKIYVVSNAHYFWSIFNGVMALDRRQIFVYALIYMYMIHVVTNTHYFPKLFNRVMTID